MAQYFHLQTSLVPSVSIYKRAFFALNWGGEGDSHTGSLFTN